MLNLIKLIENYSVIFADLDDTLFNYSYAHNMALKTVFTEFNVNINDYNKAKKEIKERNLSANHHKKELYFKLITENKRLPLIDSLKMYELYDKSFNENLLADSSMLAMFKYAKDNNKTIIAITNFYVIPALKKLQTSGFIKYIDHLVSSEEFEAEKPSRKLFDKAMELSGKQNTKDVIMFGDSDVDNLSMFDIDYYPYNCSKLLISISGKSGAGKSTLSKTLKDVWNATIIEADGYHKYERNHPEWKNVTHYNPKANNLLQLGLDIKNIYQNITNITVPLYNHHDGLFSDSKQLVNNILDVVVIEGLHTLYKEVTGDFVKIKIYIDSDLADIQKIHRDTTERNKNESNVIDSIQKRQSDFDKYIDIQKQFCNFLISINETHFKITLSGELLNDKQNIFEGNYSDLSSVVHNIMTEFKHNRYIKICD